MDLVDKGREKYHDKNQRKIYCAFTYCRDCFGYVFGM